MPNEGEVERADEDDETFDDEYEGSTTRMDFSGIREELKAKRPPRPPPRPRKKPPPPPREEMDSFSTVKTNRAGVIESAIASSEAPTPRMIEDDDEELPTMIVSERGGPVTLQEAPATRILEGDDTTDDDDDDWDQLPTQKHIISPDKIRDAIDRAKETTRRKRDTFTDENLAPAPERPQLDTLTVETRVDAVKQAAKTLQVAFDHNDSAGDAFADDEIPTIVRDLAPETLASAEALRRKRPSIARRMISPAKGAPDSEKETVRPQGMPRAVPQVPQPGPSGSGRRDAGTQQAAIQKTPFPIPGGGARPAAHPGADLDLDEILRQMEANRRRSFWGPVILFIVVAAATACLVWLLQYT